MSNVHDRIIYLMLSPWHVPKKQDAGWNDFFGMSECIFIGFAYDSILNFLELNFPFGKVIGASNAINFVYLSFIL